MKTNYWKELQKIGLRYGIEVTLVDDIRDFKTVRCLHWNGKLYNTASEILADAKRSAFGA